MRLLLVAFGIALCGSRTAAQHHPAPPPSTSRPAPSTPPRATPPPVTMPYPPLMPPPAGGLTPRVPFTTPPAALPSQPDLYRVRPGDSAYSRTHAQSPIGYGGYYGYGYDVPPAAALSAAAAEQTGMLRLTGTPESAQIFVDGYYIGDLADIEAQRVLTLPVGPHRIEIRAIDYVPTTFDVRIGPNATVTYRAALERVRPQPTARAVVPTANPTRMYLIPNCYLGNVPPKRDRLPRGCDIKRVQVIS